MTTPLADIRLPAGIGRGLTILFSIAGGAAVGNLYWSQPLLADIAGSLSIPTGTVGLLVTVTQIGYAIGVFFVVPLGDTVNRKRFIPGIMLLSALALAASALVPGFTGLLVTLALIGVTTVAGPLLTPLAGDLASDQQRGQAVGIVASGLLTGLLVSRTISGILADAFGWRAVYAAAAVMMVILALLLARFLPSLPPRSQSPYGRLLRSVLTTVAQHRVVRPTLLIGASAMCVFTMFWTGLTFLLSADPFSYPPTRIGLMGLVGLAGALTALRVGRLHDRGFSVPALGAALALALVSLAVSGLGAASVIAIILAVVLLSVAIQSINVLCQTRMMSIAPDARSRMNTVFIVSNFIGGAVGSTLAGALWQAGGWAALMAGSALVIAFAFTVWLTQRHRALAR